MLFLEPGKCLDSRFEAGLKFEHPEEEWFGFIGLALDRVSASEIEGGLHIVRLELCGGGECLDGFFGSAETLQDDSAVVMRGGVFGPEVDGGVEMIEGFGEVAGDAQSVAKVVMDFGVIGEEVERLLVSGNGIAEVALRGQGDAEVVMGVFVFRGQCDGGAVGLGGSDRIARFESFVACRHPERRLLIGWG
jgi:hypothetical protein